ncbi:MAG TPA: general secretion pathway protein GspB, partial [Ideonella sp.]|nr:general secretion pathway protein GspB [Ideonella sp.]
PPAERRILALDELPPEIRRSLPPLAVSGSIYSDDAASRFVMINGEAVHEGGRITPELTLEQIRLKSAVLRYKGYRYRIPL